jgi:hypothetical protein
MEKLINQLLNILMCTGEKEIKSIFLQLCSMSAHQTHTCLKSRKAFFTIDAPFPLEVGQTHAHLGIPGRLNHTLSGFVLQPYEVRKELKSQLFGTVHEICFSPTNC